MLELWGSNSGVKISKTLNKAFQMKILKIDDRGLVTL
jgi:hypothetical protein